MVINKLSFDNLKKYGYPIHTNIFITCCVTFVLFRLDKYCRWVLNAATGLPRIVVISSIPFGCVLSLIYCLKHLIKPVGNN